MSKEEKEINIEYKDEIEKILDEPLNKNFFTKIKENYFNKNLTFYKLKTLYSRIEDMYFKLKDIFEKVKIEEFLTETINIDKLKEIYYKKGLDKSYPNLDFDKLKYYYDNPITNIKSPKYKDHIIYDKVVSRKYIISIMQMIFNKMDLVITFCGGEGTGKTTASTQDAYLLYYYLSELGLIEYKFNLENIMYYNLKSIIQGFNRHSKNPFRIFILDEGNELNRKNWNNPLVDLFFQKLRRERKHLRIIIINLPQLGELITELTLSRVNFVFQLEMKGDLETKLADKGFCYFYIIPRFSKIYSYLNERILTQENIKNEFGKILEDKKKYFQVLPKYLCIQKFKRNGVWSFNEEEYDRQSKEANEQFSTNGVTLTKTEIYYLERTMNLKKLGVKPGTKEYHVLAHLKNKKLKVAVKNKEDFEFIEQQDEKDREENL